MNSTTEKLAVALHILARDIQSDDGVANAAILEAAVRLREQQLRIKRLEEAGDVMAEWLEDMRNLGADACLSYAWREAKEAKL